MSAPFFLAERLVKRFGGLTAVNEVSLELRREEIVGLIGPNGAGKTTLLRLITKILRPDSGRIVFNGEDITALRPWEVVDRGIAGTFQNTRPFRHLPIVANVMVPLVEPRGGLNPAESELLARSIRRLHKGGRFGRLHSEGPAVLMIEHKLKELMSI